jgi:hypothetical protein
MARNDLRVTAVPESGKASDQLTADGWEEHRKEHQKAVGATHSEYISVCMSGVDVMASSQEGVVARRSVRYVGSCLCHHGLMTRTVAFAEAVRG